MRARSQSAELTQPRGSCTNYCIDLFRRSSKVSMVVDMPFMTNLYFYPPTLQPWQAAFAPASDWSPSTALIDRIRRAYQLGIASFGGSGESMWTGIAGLQTSIHELLISDDDKGFRQLLADPATTNLYFGIDNLVPSHINEMAEDPIKFGVHAGMIADNLYRLAEALGAQKMLRPSGDPGPTGPSKIDVEDLIIKIERKLGIALAFKTPLRGEFGLPTRRGLLSYRVPLAIYQACRLTKLGAQSVLEIGAGMGRTALYARALGIKRYTVIDIPMSLVVQAGYLAAMLGEDAIHLAGDEGDAGDKISLRPASDLSTLGHFDVVLNVNSITELDVANARAYIKFAYEHARLFLSINHEENAFSAAELFDERTWKVERFPYWMRAGYLEEIATPRAKGALTN